MKECLLQLLTQAYARTLAESTEASRFSECVHPQHINDDWDKLWEAMADLEIADPYTSFFWGIESSDWTRQRDFKEFCKGR